MLKSSQPWCMILLTNHNSINCSVCSTALAKHPGIPSSSTVATSEVFCAEASNALAVHCTESCALPSIFCHVQLLCNDVQRILSEQHFAHVLAFLSPSMDLYVIFAQHAQLGSWLVYLPCTCLRATKIHGKKCVLVPDSKAALTAK